MHARRAYHRLSRQGRGPARPKPRPQAKTLDGYLRPAPQPPIELKPLLQQMKTMFSVQPVSDVGSQPLSSPPLSSPPAFNRITNLRGSQRCPNKNCTQKGSIPSVKRKTISTKTDLGRWLCSQTGQLLIGAPWCCNSCFQAKCKEWHKLSPEQQGATAAASPASAAAPQPSPAPTPSTSRAPTKLFANLKAGGSQERAIKERAWQGIDDVLKTYYPHDVTGLFASLLQDKRVRTAIPSDTKLSEIAAT